MEIIVNLMHNEMFITVFTGVIVLVIHQIINDYIIKPKLKLRSLKEKVAATLTMYRNLYSNPVLLNQGEREDKYLNYNEASTKIREIASELAGYIGILNNHDEKRDRLTEACRCLIGLSNGLFRHKNVEEDLCKDNRNLEIEILEQLEIELL